MNEPLDILISHVCGERMSYVGDALAAEDRQALRGIIEGAYLEVRDDLGQYAAPEWLGQTLSPSAMIHATCMRLGDEMQRQTDIGGGSSRILRDAAVQAVACLCLAMDEEEERQLGRTLSAMRRHAKAAQEIAARLSTCPALTGLSPQLRRAVKECVLDHIGEFASVLVSDHRAAAPDIGSRILQACPPSVVQHGDLALLALDGRRDRRGVDLAAGLVKLCMEASAHALGTDAPDRLRSLSTRMAAAALASEPTLEPRFRARLLATGRIPGGDGK